MRNIKILIFSIILMFAFCIAGFTDEIKNSEDFKKADFNIQISYVLGLGVINELNLPFTINHDYFIKGIKDYHAKQIKMTDEQINDLLEAYKDIYSHKWKLRIKKEAEANKSVGLNFLTNNKTKKGVVTLPSGLQYKILKKGSGASPGINSIVKCHYKSIFIDGTVFGSSYKRNKPKVFEINSSLQGWAEALQLMKAGSKWMLFVPSDLAYGDRGNGRIIKPGVTLIFEIEMLKILEE